MVQHSQDFERGPRIYCPAALSITATGLKGSVAVFEDRTHTFSHLTPYEASNIIPFDADA